MSTELQINQESSENPTGLSLSEILVSAGEETINKFGFFKVYLPDLAKGLFDDKTGLPNRVYEALIAALGSYDHAGLVENHADVMDAVRVFYAETIFIQVADALQTQLSRMQASPFSGTWSDKDAQRVRSITEALYKANKAAQEVKDAAGFSRVSRKAVGTGGGGEFGRLLLALEQVATGQTMAVEAAQLLVQRRPARLDESQGDLLEANVVSEDGQTLTPEERHELMSSAS